MYDDDRDALAAEYVLGTLSADERDQAEALLVIDPGFAETVRVWERRLGELNVMVEAVEPPAEVWERIKIEIDGAERRIAADAAGLPSVDETAAQTAPEESAEATAPDAGSAVESTAESMDDLAAHPSPEDEDDSAAIAALASSLLPPQPPSRADRQPSAKPAAAPTAPRVDRNADVIYLARSARRWRALTAGIGAIAALLALFIGVSQFAPGLLPAARFSHSIATAPAPESRFVAVLQQEPTAPAFLLTVDPQQRTMTVRGMTASAGNDRSYELWLIPGKNSKPQSLGLVGGTDFITRPLPGSFDVADIGAASYAVSLEPAGGSKTGAPTGPILFTGRMVEAVPNAPPPKT